MAQIKITSRFVDERGGQLFAPGIWTVDNPTATRLIARGKATLVAEKTVETPAVVVEVTTKVVETPAATPAPVVTTPAVPVSPIVAASQSDIPADFPERLKLISAGITTVAQLKAEGVKEKIDAIEGIGPETMNKIGLAIAELA